MRGMTRDHEVEAVGDATYGRELEFGTAVAEIADDAIHAAAPSLINDRCDDHGIAARLKPLFVPGKQGGNPNG